jgi:hypothetical protein
MKLYTLILDRSGSMSSIWPTIIPVVDQHIETKTQNCLSSLMLFDDRGLEYVYKYQGEPTLLDKKYSPRGNTPLRDAIMYGIETLIKDWGDFLWQDFVEVEFTIFTDGHENSSRFWKSEDVARALNHFQEQYNWKFSFIGSGSQSDVANYAKEFGIKTENVVSYSKAEDLEAAFAKV